MVFENEGVPEKIIHRDEQIKRIEFVFDLLNKQNVGENLIILGGTGSGKSATIKYLLKKQDPSKYIFVSAHQSTTTLQVFKLISKSKSNDMSEIISELANKFKEKGKIIVIDELNRIRDIEEFFNNLNALFRNTNVSFILITNNRLYISRMPEDARLTLFFSRIEFPAYTVEQLYDILKMYEFDLHPEGFGNNDDRLRDIAGIGASEKGSARMVLDIARKCALRRDFSEESVRKVFREREENVWEAFVQGMNPTEISFLRTMIDLECANIPITNSEIKIRTNLSQARIAQLITVFEKGYGLVETKPVYRGRFGNYRNVFLKSEVLDIIQHLI